MDFKKKIVVTKEQFENEVLPQLERYKYITGDLETTGLSFLTDKICGIGLAVLDDEVTEVIDAWYIPVMYHEGMEETLGLNLSFFGGTEEFTLSPEYVWGHLRRILLREDKIIIFQNLKFDMDFLINVDIDLRPKLGLPPWNVSAELTDRDKIKHFLETLPKEASCADTMIMSWLLDENKLRHGLKELAKNELGLDMTKLDKIMKNKRFHEAPASETFPYALLDPIATGKLFILYFHKLKEEKLWDVFWRVEMPFVGVLQGIERRGIPVNKEVLIAIGNRCETEMTVIQTEIFKLAGKVFNIDSGAQLAVVLHDECGLPVLNRTPKGSIKVDADTMTQLLALGRSQPDGVLKDRNIRGLEIIEVLLHYRKMKKVHGTYVLGTLEAIQIDGRIRPSFHHTGTVTGRLSSSGINFQNLPSGPIFRDYMSVDNYVDIVDKLREQVGDDEYELEVAIQKHFLFTVAPVKKNGKSEWEVCKDKEAEAYETQWKIRDAFQETVRDWWMVVADLSQMELRMTAHLTGDSLMTQGFIDGHDIHQYNASVVQNKPISEVTKIERRDAKAVSFGLVYGKTVRGFAVDWFEKESDFWNQRPNAQNEFGEINKKYLKMAQAVVDAFFNAFPDVAQGIEACNKFVSTYGYIKTITGRKRRLPEVFSMSNGIKNRAKRQAFNGRVQGSSADFLKMAMIKLEREMYIFQEAGTDYQIGQIAQVHDELIAPAPKEIAVEVMEMVQYYMENVVKLSCPIKADAEVGWKYGSCK